MLLQSDIARKIQKIADYLFATFFEKFSYYPAVTSAWMIDTETLNYIHKEYGVKIQQITREQYGTDSYTFTVDLHIILILRQKIGFLFPTMKITIRC